MSVADEVRSAGPAERFGEAGFDRTPPQDLAAEQCVLGGMLLSKDAIADVVEILRSADFYRPAHATVFDIVIDLYGRGEPADPITVAAALTDAGELQRIGGGAYLHTLIASVPTAANSAYYARIVAERAVLRRLVEAGTRIVQMGYGAAAGTGRDVDDIVDLAQQAVYDVTERRSGDDFAILADLLQPALDEIEAVGSRDGVMVGVPTGFGDLDRLLNGLHPGQLIVVAGRPGLGKALALDTPLPTPDGWTTMGRVRIGDRLLDAAGRSTVVTALSEVQFDRPCYELVFSDGSTIVADGSHRWLTRTRVARGRGRPGEVHTTDEIRDTLQTADRRMNHSVTNTAPLELPARDLPVGPYTVGAWLGADEGACAEPEVTLHIEAEGEGCGAATIGRLRTVGLLTDRRVPTGYLRASADQRRALLAGLLDTAGTVAPTGHVQLRVADERLARGVYELVVSLGYRCTMTTDHGRPVLDFSTVDDVFRIEAKRLEHKERRRAVSSARSGLRYIVAVRPAASVPVRCVTVDNPDHLYLAGRAMIPTHNSTAAMDFARSASVRHNMASAIFSLEMSKIEIVTRLLAAEARVPMHVLRSGQLSDDDWTRLARRMGEISEAPIYVDDTPNMTLMEIRAKARRMRQRNELKLVVVDYLQLMTSPKRVESRQQEVAELSRGLKLLAKEIECPVVAVSQLNRGPEQRTDKRPQLSDLRESGCLPALTRVMRADTNQETTIGALLASGETDIPVWALDGKLKYVPATMTHAFPTGVRSVFRMRLASGREVEATGNHRFLAIDGWTPLEQLAPGSRVAVPRHLPPPLRISRRSDGDVAELARELDELTPATAVPTEVFALPKRQVRLFVRDVWARHGWVSAQRGGRVSCTSTSRALLAGLRSLLLRFGISTRLRTVRGDTDWPQYTLDVAGREDQLRFLREIGVPGPRSEACVALLARLEQPAQLDTVPDEVWSRVREVLTEHRAFSPLDAGRVRATPGPVPGPSRLAQVAAVLDSADLELHATNDVFWDEVESIEPLGAQPVYDATVLGLHNFIADGVVVHNSIEQDADVVILLHRDDYYDKESPRAGEADFIVAKHRNGPTDTVTVAAQLHFSRFVDMAL